MDGNGRWATEKGLSRVAGHKAGFEVVRDIVKCARSTSVDVLSLFAFSTENWLRPSVEVDAIMFLFSKAIDEELKELHAEGVQLRFIGQIEKLSKSLQKKIQYAEEMTRNNQDLILQLAVSYGGRWDITQACKKIASLCVEGKLDPNAISEEMISSQLSFGDLVEPDLLIRTSGELRTSNFFIWQLAYTELHFTKTYWPDFTVDDFHAALEDYEKRKRRFGKVEETC